MKWRPSTRCSSFRQLVPTAHVQVCGTTPCMLLGAEHLKQVCQRRINPAPHQLSADGLFSWEEVECLGACVNAPMVQIGKDTYEDLTPESLDNVLAGIEAGEQPETGSAEQQNLFRAARRFDQPHGPDALFRPAHLQAHGGASHGSRPTGGSRQGHRAARRKRSETSDAARPGSHFHQSIWPSRLAPQGERVGADAGSTLRHSSTAAGIG